MSLLLKRLKIEWPGWMVVLFFALLPFGRFSEIPLSIFAFSLPFLWRSSEHQARIRQIALILVPLFLCFWLPMVISSFDSFLPEKSSLRSLAALRYLAAAISVAVLLKAKSSHWRVLRWTSYLLVFWAVDGFVQLFTGTDLFGVVMHPDRLNAMFVHQYQFFRAHACHAFSTIAGVCKKALAGLGMDGFIWPDSWRCSDCRYALWVAHHGARDARLSVTNGESGEPPNTFRNSVNSGFGFRCAAGRVYGFATVSKQDRTIPAGF